MRSRLPSGLWVVLFLAFLLGHAPAAPSVGNPASSAAQIEATDRQFNEKSYAAALEGYRAVLASGAELGERRPEIEYRIAVSLGKAERWDEALAEAEDFVRRWRGTLWEARGQHWLGRLLIAVPHQGYLVRRRVYRGASVPAVAGGERPQPVWLYREDRKEAIAAFEAAKRGFERAQWDRHGTNASPEKLRGRPPGSPRLAAEETDLNFDLARLLQGEPPETWYPKKLLPPSDPSWRIDPRHAYQPDWPAPKRVLFLLRQVQSAGTPHQVVLARLAEALFLDYYHPRMASLASEVREDETVRRIPYPYQRRTAEPLLQSILGDYPEDPISDQVLYTLGEWRYRRDNYVGALAAYRQLLRTYPQSKWCSDARRRIFWILRRNLSLDTIGPQPSGRRAHIQIKSSNVRRVSLRAYRIRLEELLSEGDALNDPNWVFSRFVVRYLSRHPEATLSSPVARWEISTRDRGNHWEVSETIPTPLERPGAYIVVASAVAESGTAESPLVVSGLLVITDQILVRKVARDRMLVFVADARTGVPVANAHVMAREVYTLTPPEQRTTSVLLLEDSHRNRHARPLLGRTDADGLFERPLTPIPDRDYHQVEVIAWCGNQYAVSDEFWEFVVDYQTRVKIYSYTDRPVYRPTQVVHFRQLVARREAGRLVPAVGQPVAVAIVNPRGGTVLESTLTTDRFGTVAGDLPLTAEARLGEYTINAQLVGTQREPGPQGGSRFRVEEYRKPEFEVSVKPERTTLRAGERGHARVKARYYFGAPVPGARVLYRIFRSLTVPDYPFQSPFDFLYRNWGQRSYDYGGSQGELVSTGQTRTNGAGEAEIEFQTAVNRRTWGELCDQYTVEAEVTDASRRTIGGSGAVVASRQQFFATLDMPHNFFSQGDRVPIEVATHDLNGYPVAATGSLKIYLQRRRGRRIAERLIHAAPLKTNATGRAKTDWIADRSGAFRIAFEARDAWKEKVTASLTALVAGPDIPNGIRFAPSLRFFMADRERPSLQLIAANHRVPQGGRARVLLITDQPGATVLLTQETDNQILAQEVVRMPERTRVIEFSVNGRHAPNFYLHATMVRDGKVQQTEEEFVVPSPHRFVDLKLIADKKEYRPGERATFELLATDWQGQPAQGVFSVGIVDASLFAIQPEYAPDIRPFFYAERRLQHGWTSSSTGVKWEPHAIDTQRPPKEKEHDWVAPEGMGQLEEWPGLPALGIEGSFDHEFGSAGVRGGFGGFSGGFGAGGLGRVSGVPGYAAPRARRIGGVGGGSADRGGEAEDEQAPASRLVPPVMRTTFADTAYWAPAVVTDAQGRTTIQFNWPDNLTTWRAITRGWTVDAQVGTASATVVTRKELLVRLQAPRFFVERDEALLSANIHNYLPQAKRTRVSLQSEGDELELVGGSLGQPADAATAVPAEQWVEVPREGEARVDWRVRVRRAGTVKIRMTAQTDAESDAVEMTVPAIVYGVEKLTVSTGTLIGEKQTAGDGAGVATARFTIDVPRDRKSGSSELNVQLTPSLASTMLDSLPYLTDYPYGCIEQTMSRFLPSVVVAKTLREAGLSLEDLEKRANAYMAEQKREAGGQRVPDSPYTYPQGMPGRINVAEQARQLRYHRLDRTPVFHAERLSEMVTAGLQRIVAAQNSDGGWGWWPGSVSDPYMSAYVMYGLLTLREAGRSTPEATLKKAIEYGKRSFLEGDGLHRLANAGAVLSIDPGSRDAIRPRLSGQLYEQRERLSTYTKALLAMALQRVGENDKAKVVLANLLTTVKIDLVNGTASWGGGGEWWRWYENRVETGAAALQALLLIQPDHAVSGRRLAPMIVQWLVNNRRGGHWASTKETAMAVYALADFARVNRELSPEYTVTVDFDGRQQRTYQVNSENVLFFDNRFIVPDALLRDGVQTVTITRSGTGNLYYSAYLRSFSLEEDLKGTGNEISVRRRYFRLLPEDPARINARRTAGLAPRYAAAMDDVYRREPLESGAGLQSGDLIEVELFLESKNDYDYLVFEDLKPAGCEPIELRSRGREENGLWAQMELRDQKVAFFLTSLPQGTRTLTYRLRAETPGQFHVLPTNGYAMYAPEIRTLSDEFQIGIR